MYIGYYRAVCFAFVAFSLFFRNLLIMSASQHSHACSCSLCYHLEIPRLQPRLFQLLCRSEALVLARLLPACNWFSPSHGCCPSFAVGCIIGIFLWLGAAGVHWSRFFQLLCRSEALGKSRIIPQFQCCSKGLTNSSSLHYIS